MAKETARARGRPPASLSAATRERILRAGQKRFALFGYDKTTVKDIADEAGLTTGALYHYFDSKQTLFVSTLMEEDARVLQAFEQTTHGVDGAIAKLTATFDRAVQLHHEDEFLARLVAIAPIEIDRHPEFQAAIEAARAAAPGNVHQFFEEIVRDGQAAGEIDPTVDQGAIVQMLLAVAQGLAQLAGLVHDDLAHARAIDAFKRLLEGSLIPSTARSHRQRRRRRRAS